MDTIADSPVPSISSVAPRLCPSAIEGECVFDAPEPFLDRSGMIGAVSVERCRYCGTGISRPSLADVAFLYEDRSSQDFQPNTGGIVHAIKNVAFRRQARALMKDIGGTSRRIIDFGCGSGLFTRQLVDLLPDVDVLGCDFHDEPPVNLSRDSYRSFADLGDDRGGADLVLAMHVLEHDDDSAALLKRIVAAARPGGRVFIEVPNIDCIWASIFGKYWDAWYLPYHRVHFSKAGLRSLMTAAGLTVERESGGCVPTMGRTIANLLDRRNSALFILLGAALHPIQWLGERLTRRPSALRIVVRVPA